MSIPCHLLNSWLDAANVPTKGYVPFGPISLITYNKSNPFERYLSIMSTNCKTTVWWWLLKGIIITIRLRLVVLAPLAFVVICKRFWNCHIRWTIPWCGFNLDKHRHRLNEPKNWKNWKSIFVTTNTTSCDVFCYSKLLIRPRGCKPFGSSSNQQLPIITMCTFRLPLIFINYWIRGMWIHATVTTIWQVDDETDYYTRAEAKVDLDTAFQPSTRAWFLQAIDSSNYILQPIDMHFGSSPNKAKNI